MDGILNVWKPPGMTSHDVVAAVRRITGEKRAGHAGTLDPMAEGVLVVGVGQGTRVLEYLVDGTKEYCARIHLGVTTDTDDAEGAVLAVKDVKALRRQTIEGVLRSFIGHQEQMPPVFSALKVRGEPAYRRARHGQTVERRPRQVAIHALQLLKWQRPHIYCRVTCSKGTYVRSLARDVGEMLGCGAHLCGLVRLRSGGFTLDDAVPLPLLRHGITEGYAHQLMHPMDSALQDCSAVILGPDDAARACQGQSIRLTAGTSSAHASQPWRVYSLDGELIALLVAAGEPGLWRADKVFSPALGTNTIAHVATDSWPPSLT